MTRATVTIKTAEDRQQIARWARNVDLGTVVTFRKKSRSTEQSAKMWAMLNEVSEQVEWFGQKLDAEDWKDMFTASLRHARVVPGIDKGTYVPLGMHTSTLTIDEMSNLIELIYAFGAEHGVTFKEPKDNESVSSPETDAAEAPSPSSAGAAESLSSAALTNTDTTETPVADLVSVETSGDGDAPHQPSPEALSDDQRAKLIEAARKLLKLSQEALSPEARLGFLESREMDWREVIDRAHWPKLESIAKVARAVVNAKRTYEQATGFVAEMLECSVEDLKGNGNG